MTFDQEMVWRIRDETLYMWKVFSITEGAQMQHLKPMWKNWTSGNSYVAT